MAANEPQTSGAGESKFNAGTEPVKQESTKGSVQKQNAEVRVHPSAVVETTTTTKKIMDVDGKPTEVQETVKSKPQEKADPKPQEDKQEKKGAALDDTDAAVIAALMKKGYSYKDAKANVLENNEDRPKKKRHWLLEHLDEMMARQKEENKPQDYMTGFKFGYETVAGLFILGAKLASIFGPKPAQAGVTAKQGTVAGLHGKEGGTFKMLENAGISGAKPQPGQKPSLGTQIKQRAEGMKQGVQTALRSAAPGRKR